MKRTALLLCAAAVLPTSSAAEASQLLDEMWNGRVYDVTEETLDLVLEMPEEAHKGWLVQFYTPWCGRCIKFNAHWNELASAIDQRGPDSTLRLAKMDASDSTAVIKRFKLKGFPEFLLFTGSQYRRFRGELVLAQLQAFASGSGVGKELVRKASTEFALKTYVDDYAAAAQERTQLGIMIAMGCFLLGILLGCFCSLHRCACVLTCGLCCRERRRHDPRKLKRKKE